MHVMLTLGEASISLSVSLFTAQQVSNSTYQTLEGNVEELKMIIHSLQSGVSLNVFPLQGVPEKHTAM